MRQSRREFMRGSAAATVAVAAAGLAGSARAAGGRDYKIAVDGWSLHKEVFAGKIKQTDIFKIMREEFDIGAFNLVNNMLEVPTADYVGKLGREAAKHKVEIPLIMIDSEGALGSPDQEARDKAVRNHKKWIWIASDLGCHSIRVNWGGAARGVEKDDAKAKELIDYSVETYGKLTEIGKKNGISIIIENHWGPSSYPDLMERLMKGVNSDHFGTLPDFGNFPEEVDKYDAIDRLMPWAKAVSAKCYDFGADGNETKIDFARMIEICVDKHGYHGWMGIEFEGKMPEREGIAAAKKLLERLKA